MRGVKPPGSPRVPRSGRATASRAAPRAARTLRSAALATPASAKRASSAEPEHRGPGLVDTDEGEQVAFQRKHAADLEEESRRHVAAEAGAELARREKELKQRRVQALSLDDRRKKRGRPTRDDQDERDDEEEREAEQRAKELVTGGGQLGYFQDTPVDRMGDPSLSDPNEMKRVLGASVRFAQHAMILAEERFSAGLSRTEALAYLAGLYCDVDDRAYAEKALRAYGPATGIVDLYPLELVDHLLTHVPDFFHKARRAPIFGDALVAKARPSASIVLSYDPNLRIRGFALEGGPRPGYRFEPIDPPGTYRLAIDTPGRYEVMVSAISRDGWLLVDTLLALIDDEAPEEAQLTKRSEERVEASAQTKTAEPAVQPSLPNDIQALPFPRRI